MEIKVITADDEEIIKGVIKVEPFYNSYTAPSSFTGICGITGRCTKCFGQKIASCGDYYHIDNPGIPQGLWVQTLTENRFFVGDIDYERLDRPEDFFNA